MIVLAYLAAITTANLLAAAYGRTYPWVVVANALVLIAFDLVARDRLHDRWAGAWLPARMGVLIAAGGILAWLVNRDAGRIAVASAVAFAAAAAIDAIVYHWRRRDPWTVRVDRSNLAGAAVDSILFPILAGLPAVGWLALALFVAKVLGGAVWARLLAPRHAPARH